MQLSGLILDVYDDVQGNTLRNIFPTQGSMPELVKQAHAITASEFQQLPDDVFALVMVEGGDKFRKYACIDSGNTMLSVAYFMENKHKLPEEVQKVAASNLLVACGWYDLNAPEELAKTAGILSWAGNKAVNKVVKNPVGAAMTALTLPSMVKGTKGAISNNLGMARGAESAVRAAGGGFHDTVAEGLLHAGGRPLHGAGEFFKSGEVVATTDMPISPPKDSRPAPSATTIKKTASSSGDVGPEVNTQTEGKQPTSLPQMHMKPVVLTEDLQAKHQVKEKKAERYALASIKRYPLDAYDHVKTASVYLNTHWDDMTPSVRREYCVNLVKRAEELSIPLDDRTKNYGSEKLASMDQFEIALISRQRNSTEDMHPLLHKIAQAYALIAPKALCEALSDFDKIAHITHLYGSSIPDPFSSVYKHAEDEFSDVIGNLTVTGGDLKALALTGKGKISSTFGEEVFTEFRKDPVGIYKSMPTAEKKMLIRMATENSPGSESLR